MSQENVEIVRRAWEVYVDHGWMHDAVLDEYFTEDCVVEDYPEMPDRASYVGREGVRERDRHFAEIWGDFVIEPVEFIDGGSDVVVVTVAIRGHGIGSGAPIDAPTAFVTELRDGKVVRDRAFTSKSQALEAVGLSAEDAHADS
jgi:ketosteroid isomerase-like protein